MGGKSGRGKLGVGVAKSGRGTLEWAWHPESGRGIFAKAIGALDWAWHPAGAWHPAEGAWHIAEINLRSDVIFRICMPNRN